MQLIKTIRSKYLRPIWGYVLQLKRLRKYKFSTLILYSKLINHTYELAISPNNLLAQEYSNDIFMRYDTIVRLLTIEKYENKSDDAFHLYNKMQKLRNASPSSDICFEKLINNVNKNGFDYKSTININTKGHLIDGSHRLALALHTNYPILTAKIDWQYHKTKVDYSLDWFKHNNFTPDECKLIEDRKNLLFIEKGLYFPVIFWPPVYDIYEEIEQGISHKIVKNCTYHFKSDTEFSKFVKKIYKIDDISDWKVEKKLAHMQDYKKDIRIVWLDLSNPMYRKKGLNNADISVVGEKLKRQIRNKYQEHVSNYIYDIICHTGDNWQHNSKMNEIFDHLL